MTTVIIPQAIALKGIPDVELVAVGTWNSVSGPVTVTDDDLRQALAARECPGVHNPVIKLGHDEPDPGENKIRWDGEPAVGWISNMRLSANNAKLLGDYTGMPAWLAEVAPSAYPQRSIEIHRDFRCQIGHTHPFIITAVSLLGIYPPAVGVIRSLNDVQALYTLAAVDGQPPTEVTRSIAVGLAAPVNADTRRPLTDTEHRSAADFGADLDQWEAAVASLLTAYGVVQRQQREQLTAQIAPLIDAGRFEDLAALNVDAQTAADTLYEAMLIAAAEAITAQVAEAAAQGVIGLTAVPDELYLRRAADGIAATMASTLSATAGRDAAQLAAPGVSGFSVADTVDGKLSDLSDRFLRDQFGGAIGAARMSGRYSVLSVAPTGEHHAAEVNDSGTCIPCKAIDGARFHNLDEAMAAYGAGGYHLCSGGGRCRGRLITVWEAQMQAIGLRVGDQTLFARVAMRGSFDPAEKRDANGKWTDGEPTDAELIEKKPWVNDRGPGAPGIVYTDEAELSAYRLLGSYSAAEPEITGTLVDAAGKHNGYMAGLGNRLKGQESLARKIEQKSASKGLTMKHYTSKIGDALRYTMVVPSDRYGAGSQQAIEDFREQGYDVEVENTWQPGASYKGINTNVKKDGLIFEVQFHTPESLALKQKAHGLYEVARDATKSPEERATATKTMVDLVETLPTPTGAGGVS